MDNSKNTHSAESASLRLKRWLRVGRPAVMRLISMTIAVVVIFSFGSVAWFTAFQNAEPNGAAIKTGSLPFELAAANSETDYNYYLEAESTNTDEQQTSTMVDTIKWFMDDVTATEDNHGLHPGSHGSFTFKLYPKKQDDIIIQFSIKTSAYQYQRDNSGNILLDDQDVEMIEVIDADEDAAKFVGGHILFFEKYNEVTGNYAERINGYFQYDIAEHSVEAQFDSSGEIYYPITVYWIWPNTFGQIVFDRGDADLRDAAMFDQSQTAYTPVGSDTPITPRNELIQYILEDSGDYFFSNLETGAASLDTMLSSAENIKTYIIPLSNGYNNADQVIGENVNFVLCELFADTVS